MKIYEGNIITCDEKDRVYRYLVEEKGKILYVGDEKPKQEKGAEWIDLGKLVTILYGKTDGRTLY